jgi:hypothetical protein
MRRSFALAAAAGAVLLALPVTAHAAEGDVHNVSLPFFWPLAELDDVAPDGAGGVWIGGRQGAYCVPFVNQCVLYSMGNPVVRRWTASSWKEYPINGWTGHGLIGRVASGAGQTWIGGDNTDSGYWRYLGEFDVSAFQRVEPPSGAEVRMISTGLAGTWIRVADKALNDEPPLFRRDGSGWRAFDVPGPESVIRDVQGIAPDDAWAVGAQNVDGAWRAAVARFDGTSWTWTTPPDLTTGYPGIGKVVPVGPDDVWVMGISRLAHWNGTAWTVIDAPGRIADFAVDGSETPWVATPSIDGGTLHRYSGGTWQPVAVPAGTRLNDIAATGASTIWGVGRANDAPVVVSGF